MSKRFYVITRDLHLYAGLFISPFVLAFSVSVFFLVHSWIPGTAERAAPPRSVSGVPLPKNLDRLSGKQRIDALRPALDFIGVTGEVGFVRHLPKEQKLIIPVTVPGRETTVTVDLKSDTAGIETRTTGLWDAFVILHKSPGPHLAGMRMNWPLMRVWRYLADATAYLLLFISVSGIYLWAVLRAERRTGPALIATGAISFVGMVYALSH
jgi:hypothetical protein